MHYALILSLSLIMFTLAAQNAVAFQVDHSDTNSDGSARFSDPDEGDPFPHVDANAGAPADNFRTAPAGTTGVVFGIAPVRSEPPAFQRTPAN